MRKNYEQSLSDHVICNDCAFHVKKEKVIECIHPDRYEVNCASVIFCNSFQSAEEIDSPCVSFGKDEK
ncbi:hypothetical protein DP117_24490 [Brasilonema sp. UFV-L1]|nr:hypothetical protein [Brasilonema sp. UFV-L1]